MPPSRTCPNASSRWSAPGCRRPAGRRPRRPRRSARTGSRTGARTYAHTFSRLNGFSGIRITLAPPADPGVQRDPAGVPPHDLDDQRAVVALRRGVQPVDGLHRDVHRGVEAERVVGGAQVVVDGLGHPDHLDPGLVQPRRGAQGVLAADRDQRVDAERGQVVLDPLHPGPAARARAVGQRVGPRRAEDRPAPRQDSAYRLHVEGDGVPFQRPAPAVPEPHEFVAELRGAPADQRTNNRIQSWAVAAARQHSDSHRGNTSPHERPRHRRRDNRRHRPGRHRAGRVAGRGYQEFRQYFPQPGWVEHLPEEIWQATLAACRAGAGPGRRHRRCSLRRHHQPAGDRGALGPGHAGRARAGPSSGRTGGRRRICDRLREAGPRGPRPALTGLRLDPYFTGDQADLAGRARAGHLARLADGTLAVGTVDSYLIARMTGGPRHVTDASNASRTLLFDIGAGQWSAELCELLRVPQRALPEVVPSTGVAAHTDPARSSGLALPIAGIAGDQQAALFGQACFTPGDTKCTYGTGSFVLANTGPSIVRSDAGPAVHGGLDGRAGRADLRAGRLGVRHRGGGAVAARRARAARQRGAERGAGAQRAGLRRAWCSCPR